MPSDRQADSPSNIRLAANCHSAVRKPCKKAHSFKASNKVSKSETSNGRLIMPTAGVETTNAQLIGSRWQPDWKGLKGLCFKQSIYVEGTMMWVRNLRIKYNLEDYSCKSNSTGL